jgi:bifunctional enzyme CysN/CysC
MSHQSDLIATDIDAYLRQHEQKELLRFLTCGSVDDGKSTLIGRLFYDAKLIYEDTLQSLESDSATHGTTGGSFDPALFTDGLKDEREQGITIDVAYRYFSTAKRKFIIADTPGHEQFTRNMATGASTANLAIILIDARHGVIEQTKRHSFIVSLLGIKHVLVAINKMDLPEIGYRQEVFERIRDDYEAFSARLPIGDKHFMPISALKGDNIVHPSENMPWFQGPTLMSFLDTISIASDRNFDDFRFPVQLVNRPHLNFRGFCGTISSGIIRTGEEVMVLPSRKTSTIKSIVTYDGELEEAFVPQSVTLTLNDEIDITRGDMIVRPGNVPHVGQRFDAELVWMYEEPMVPGKQYLFKHTTKTVGGTISKLRYLIDVNQLRRKDAARLKLNEIGRCSISLNEPIAFDGYKRNRSTGAFIVIDRMSNNTVAAGMILLRTSSEETGAHWDDEAATANLATTVSAVTTEERAARYGQKPATILLTGLPCSGKTSLASAIERKLFDHGFSATVLDGENLRRGISRDLGFSAADRSENLRRAAEVAKILNGAGQICIAAFVAPQSETRDKVSQLLGKDNFLLIHMKVDEQIRLKRVESEGTDVEERKPVQFEVPENADLVIDSGVTPLDECVQQVVQLLESRGFLS